MLSAIGDNKLDTILFFFPFLITFLYNNHRHMILYVYGNNRTRSYERIYVYGNNNVLQSPATAV